jgi:type IV secretory pathway VirB2 component (pilin)
MGDLETTLESLLGNITTLLTGLGVAVAVIGIVVGGLMRATAFGDERKVARSNQAIACAVIGLVIVLIAQVAAGAVNSIVG